MTGGRRAVLSGSAAVLGWVLVLLGVAAGVGGVAHDREVRIDGGLACGALGGSARDLLYFIVRNVRIVR